ncbi:MAG TPA: YihY/virulence factor BrkB family protein [Propionibacteriaceae bacterium]|nr:YihY/virulence factor BrkB family protein [Propionibacteriaceae bacterium]
MSQAAQQAEKKASGVPGGTADKPTEVPAKGWLQIVKRGFKEAKVDNVPLLAAGMAYYAFLAIFPALIAAVLLYGLFADPAQISAQINSLGSAVPEDVRKLITDQLTMASGNGKAGFGAVVAIALALFSASGGVGNMMTAINTAYDEEETRGFLKKRLIALALTLGALVFFLLVITLVAVVPAVLQVFGTGGIVFFLIQLARWALIVVVIAAGLAILYRVAPDRDAPKMRWTSVGAAFATLLWILASVGFSLYVANFSSYGKTYGAVAGFVILLLWLFITSYAILLGAEINAESEQQTIKDTTHGPEQPIGERDAVKADTIPEPEDGSADKGADKKTAKR